MSRLCALAFLIGCLGCGAAPTEGALDVAVDYHLGTPGPACLQLAASPAKPEGQTRYTSVSLDGKPVQGKLHFAVRASLEWKGDVTVVASLHRPDCHAAAGLSASKAGATLDAKGTAVITPLAFVLDETAK